MMQQVPLHSPLQCSDDAAHLMSSLALKHVNDLKDKNATKSLRENQPTLRRAIVACATSVQRDSPEFENAQNEQILQILEISHYSPGECVRS